MKPILTCIIFLFCFGTTHAQKPTKLDSLKKVLARLPPEGQSFAGDTMRVRVLCEMGKKIRSSFIDSTFIFLEKALEISQKKDWEKGIAISYYHLGESYLFKNNYGTATRFFYKSLAVSVDQEDDILVAKTYKSLGDCHSLLGIYDEALTFQKKANEIFKKQKYQKEYIKGFNNLGLVYNDMKNYEAAIITYRQGLELNKKYNYAKLDTYFRTNMAMTMIKKGNLEEALSNFLIVLSDSSRNTYSDMYVFSSLSEIYEKKKDYKKALFYYERTKLMMEKLGYNESVQILLSGVGYKIFKALKQPEKALKEHEIYSKMVLKNVELDIIKNKEYLHLEYDNKSQEKEIESWERNAIIAVGTFFILLIAGTLLFKSNKKLVGQNKTIQLQNLKIKTINTQLAEFNTVLEEKVTLRTQELSDANADLMKKNDEVMAALLEGQTTERKRVSAELHDNLGSTISGIKYRMQTLDLSNFTPKEQDIYATIMQMIHDAYSEVRLISHNLLPIEFEKRGLKGALDKLIADVNFGKKIKLSLIYREPKQPLEQEIAIELYSICLELVNNMIKHSSGTEGEVCFFYNTKSIILNVKDNGKITQKLTEGFGLKNIKARVLKFKGEVEILTDPAGIDILVKIPFEAQHS
jgi:signal transduction histidine kinase